MAVDAPGPATPPVAAPGPVAAPRAHLHGCGVDVNGADAPPQRANAVIAGVNKAGTTSLFVSLGAHPQVAPASVKETRYFLPARWGRPLDPIETYEAYFADATDEPVRLEATPAYFYGGQAVIDEIRAALGSPKVVIVLREPVSRFFSFFTYQKARLRIPEDLSLEAYLARADEIGPDGFVTPELERWFGYQGGVYADWLEAWIAAFGDDLLVIYFERLVADPAATLRQVAGHLGIAPDGFPMADLSSENRTTGFRVRTLQRIALAANRRLEPFFRRHHGLKVRVRGMYLALNAKPVVVGATADARRALEDRYREPNARLAALLIRSGREDVPEWLRASATTA